VTFGIRVKKKANNQDESIAKSPNITNHIEYSVNFSFEKLLLPRKINLHLKYCGVARILHFHQSSILIQKLSCFISVKQVSKLTIFNLCSWFC
jgi:hypothetical protein